MTDYDFSRCKLCAAPAAKPVYALDGLHIWVCATCDFHYIDYLDPPLHESQDAGEDIDDKSWKYIEERLACAEGELAWRVRLVEKYCALPGAHCLDVGAGVGQFLMRLRESGTQGQGIEPSRVRRRFAQRRFDLRLEASTIENPAWREKYTAFFDLITLWDVIEHVNFPVETIQGAFDLLKPGGALFIDTPSRDALPYRLGRTIASLTGGRLSLFLSSYYSSAPYGHKQIFTPRQLRQGVEQAGFDILAQSSGYDELLGMRPPILRPHSKIILVARKPAAR